MVMLSNAFFMRRQRGHEPQACRVILKNLLRWLYHAAVNFPGNLRSGSSKEKTKGVFTMTGGFFTFLCIFYMIYNRQRKTDLPTVYEYFQGSPRRFQGLAAETNIFTLNGKPIKIISGAMHYFRIHPSLWRDRIKKLRAMGANTLETYVPWQLHEPCQGQFDFGEGDNDMSLFLNLRRYLQMAQEEDLLVLLRPGPYICTEWDFGGLPSWLLRDENIRVRTSYQPYLDRVKIYFDKLLPLIADLQFTRGGPIIGIQLENEYGTFNDISKEYLEFLYKLYEDHGFTNETLLFTSDATSYGDRGTLPDKLLMTANFFDGVNAEFKALNKYQPNKPKMAMELWVGWLDHWMENIHNDYTSPTYLAKVLEDILGRWNGSVNLYMFHGGTNFGFMAGANADDTAPNYHADVTSYDYSAPLSEAGDYTLKYKMAKNVIETYQEPQIKRTEMIAESVKTAYPSVMFTSYMTYSSILEQLPESAKFLAERPITMENLEMNEGNGQSYGFIVYRKRRHGAKGILNVGPVRDFGVLLIDEKLHADSGQDGKYWIHTVRNFTLSGAKPRKEHCIDLLIENTGRINFGLDKDFRQQKGLEKEAIYQINGRDITGIEIFALEFKSKWVNNLKNWTTFWYGILPDAPILMQFFLKIEDEPTDTFLDMSGWHKGVVFVNGFNIGRYFRVGPQQTLYVPGPLLQKGMNKVTVFEIFKPAYDLEFKTVPNLGPTKEDLKLGR